MASDTGNKDVSVTVQNLTGNDATPSLLISLVPISPSTFEKVNLRAIDNPVVGDCHRCMKSTLSGFTTLQAGTVQSNPDAPSLLQKLYWISPELSISNGSSKLVWLNFDVWTTSVVTWKLEIKAL
jgi:hypothetical protein